MRLKLKKEDLNKGLQAVQKVAQNKSNNISSENGLLIKALHGIIEFQANDYDMGIKITVPGIIEEGGEAFIANPYLMELTRRLPSDEIEIILNTKDYIRPVYIAYVWHGEVNSWNIYTLVV